MYDSLPFPNTPRGTSEEQVMQLYNYLIQFKEELEFVLMNIGPDNLSKDLVTKLNSLGADIEKNNRETNDQIQQVSNKTLTVSDIINSASFKSALTSEVGEIEFSVNLETGNLEYKHKEK